MPKIAAGGVPPEKAWSVPSLPEWLVDADKQPRWLIKGLIPHNDITVVSGQKKLAQKSYFTMSMSACMVAGAPFGIWPACEPQRVLYALQEGGAGQTADRWKAICKGHGIDPNSLKSLHFAHRHGIKLDDKNWEEKILAKLKELSSTVLVCDPTGYMYNGDENSTRDMQKVRDMYDKIIKLGVTIISVVHLQKDANPKENFDNHVRGSGVAIDQAGAHIALRRYTNAQPTADLFLRLKEGTEKEYSVRWEFENDEAEERPLSAKMYVEDRAAAQKLSYKKCKEQLSAGQKYSATRLAEVWGLSPKRARMMIEDLEARHSIIKKDGFWYLTGPIAVDASASPVAG